MDTVLSKNSNDLMGDAQGGCWMAPVTDRPIYSVAMSPLYLPLQSLLLMFAGWVNRRQLDVIAYLQEENRVRATRTRGSTFQVLLVLH
jgi:hypothetical protein